MSVRKVVALMPIWLKIAWMMVIAARSDNLPVGSREAEHRPERSCKEIGRTDVDGAQISDEAKKVQPGCQPAPEAGTEDGSQ